MTAMGRAGKSLLLFELLSANFPNYFSILLGLVFMVIVYALPHGVIGLVQARLQRATKPPVPAQPVAQQQRRQALVPGRRAARADLVGEQLDQGHRLRLGIGAETRVKWRRSVPRSRGGTHRGTLQPLMARSYSTEMRSLRP